MSDVVYVNVYLTDLDNYSLFNEIYSEYFSEIKPPWSIVEVSAIPADANVEIKLVAVQ